MNRRGFVALIGGALAAPLASAQRSGKVYRIGWLDIAPRPAAAHLVAALEQGLRDHGYVVGQNVVIEFRFADGKPERLPDLARELVRSSVDLIVVGTNQNTSAARSVTQSIPIVFAVGTDVIGQGFVKNLARPGGNITGLTWDVGGEILAKRLELLKELAPGISRVAVLWVSPFMDRYYREPIDKAASVLGISTIWLEVAGDLDRKFTELVRRGADAVFSMAGTQGKEIIALASKYRLPSAHGVPEYVDAGGLMSYGPSLLAAYRSAARLIDKILKGAKPGDLPVEQPMKIDLVINLKTAKALGIKVPQIVLLRADRVIE